jgi:hypothetical protein
MLGWSTRRVRLRQVWGTYSGTVEPERSVDSRRQLPDADDFPSLPAELATNAFIAGQIVFTLFIPEGAVGFRADIALGAAVPEASVDEDGDFLLGNRGLGRWPLGKRKVGLSWQWKMSSPAGELYLRFQKDLRSVVFEEVLLVAVEAAGVDRLFALYAHSS